MTGVRRPLALRSDAVWASWRDSETEPELACAYAWSDACRRWWHHPADARLRRRVVDRLFIDERDLDGWKARGLDQTALLRAHAHVIASRVGFERSALHRVLTTGSLRSDPVVTYQRSGATVQFPDAASVPALVAELPTTYEALPEHPFARAAWISQAIGAVHPFIDANGGTGRFLSSLELARAWLPPLVLTELQRNSTYAWAIAEADRDFRALVNVVYDVVQQELAGLLVDEDAEDPMPVDWTMATRERAMTWTAIVDGAWRDAAGMPVTRVDGDPASLARFVRRGYRSRLTPTPHLVRWSSETPVPWHFELLIAPARGGDTTWTVASVTASVGADGALGPLVLDEPIATRFVGAPEENEPALSGRFERWLSKRVEQSIRGLAAWM